MSTSARKAGGRAWVVCLIAIFGGIALALVQNKVSPVMSVIMEAFGIDMATAGILSTIFTLMGIVMALPAAMLIKRFGPRASGAVALACAVAGSLLGLFTTDITVLLISRIIEGTGIGIIAVLAPSVISMWFPPEQRGLPMGIWGSWMMVSQAVLFFAATPITETWGWQGMWMLGMGACIVACALFIVFVKSPSPEESFADVENENVSMVEGLKCGPSWVLALSALCFTYCTFTFVSWISSYWAEPGVTGWDAAEIGRWVAILYLVEMVYAWIVGAALNKIANRKLAGAIGFVVYGITGLAAFSLTGSGIILAFIFIFIFPIFDALVPCVAWAIAPETAREPMYASISLGILNIGLNTGTLLSAPVSGMLVQRFGWMGAGVSFLVVAVVGAALLMCVKLPRRAAA